MMEMETKRTYTYPYILIITKDGKVTKEEYYTQNKLKERINKFNLSNMKQEDRIEIGRKFDDWAKEIDRVY